MDEKRYSPSLFVRTLRARFVLRFLSVTFAPATSAPEGSLTAPFTEAVACWEKALFPFIATNTVIRQRAIKKRSRGE
jgi:hypothetical protein